MVRNINGNDNDDAPHVTYWLKQAEKGHNCYSGTMKEFRKFVKSRI